MVMLQHLLKFVFPIIPAKRIPNPFPGMFWKNIRFLRNRAMAFWIILDIWTIQAFWMMQNILIIQIKKIARKTLISRAATQG